MQQQTGFVDGLYCMSLNSIDMNSIWWLSSTFTLAMNTLLQNLQTTRFSASTRFSADIEIPLYYEPENLNFSILNMI